MSTLIQKIEAIAKDAGVKLLSSAEEKIKAYIDDALASMESRLNSAIDEKLAAEFAKLKGGQQ